MKLKGDKRLKSKISSHNFFTKNRKGQFYLLAAILIIALIIGFVAVKNFSQNKNPAKIYDLGKELGVEGGKVLDYGVINERMNMENLVYDFYGNFTIYAGDESRKIYFILGDNEGNICVFNSSAINNGNIIIGNSRIPEMENRIVPDCSPGICESSSDGNLMCTINDIEYNFKLNEGENFYFVISEQIGEENHVISG